MNHYLFTPRDMTRWCLGLLRYDLLPSDTSVVPVLKVCLQITLVNVCSTKTLKK